MADIKEEKDIKTAKVLNFECLRRIVGRLRWIRNPISKEHASSNLAAGSYCGVAQGLEQLPYKQEIGGPNPFATTKAQCS